MAKFRGLKSGVSGGSRLTLLKHGFVGKEARWFPSSRPTPALPGEVRNELTRAPWDGLRVFNPSKTKNRRFGFLSDQALAMRQKSSVRKPIVSYGAAQIKLPINSRYSVNVVDDEIVFRRRVRRGFPFHNHIGIFEAKLNDPKRVVARGIKGIVQK